MTMQLQDLHFSFDPMLFPDPPSVPPSSELFSTTETNDIFGFLDNFTDWDLHGDLLNASFQPDALLPLPPSHPPPQDPFLGSLHELPTLNTHHAATNLVVPQTPEAKSSARAHPYARQLRPRTTTTKPTQREHSPDPISHRIKKSVSPGGAGSGSGSSGGSSTPGPSSASRTKPLLDDKQKRMNHIMSEQKRRNAIRDGYAQLTALLAPAGAPPGMGMPTRGRPKGSVSKGKSRPGAGKSGVLLRAVEYCRWLEEGRDALLEEVKRLESAAGIRVNL
jgi:hypothetical protein